MSTAVDIADVARLLADPSRATILQSLMDQRARTTSELARLAHIVPSTASEHLGRLTDARLVVVESQGRHRYYRLADARVAALLEAIMAFTPEPLDPPAPHVGSDLRFLRTCYDHPAGTVATTLYDKLLTSRALIAGAGGVELTAHGAERFGMLGIDADALQAGRRPVVRSCLDWTERRNHLAGSLGAAILDAMRERRWVRAGREPRTLRLTAAGRTGLATCFAIDVDALSDR